MHRKLALGAVAATAAASLVVAAPSMAATTPIPLSFDHLTLVAPSIGAQNVVTPSTAPLTVTADTDLTSGDFSIQPANFSAPTYNFTSPVPGSLTLALASPATGAVNFATGAVTMSADMLATINIQGLGTCAIDTGALNLSTATTLPYPGVAFPAGPTGVATGDGAFGVGWTSLPAGTGAACSTIDPLIDNGAGGIWISRGLTPGSGGTATTATPKIATSAAKPAAVTAGKAAKVKVTVKNSGADDAKNVKVCLVAKKPLTASKCQTVVQPKAGTSKTLAFTVKTTAKTTAGKHLLKLTATGAKASTVTLVTKAAAKPVRAARAA